MSLMLPVNDETKAIVQAFDSLWQISLTITWMHYIIPILLRTRVGYNQRAYHQVNFKMITPILIQLQRQTIYAFLRVQIYLKIGIFPKVIWLQLTSTAKKIWHEMELVAMKGIWVWSLSMLFHFLLISIIIIICIQTHTWKEFCILLSAFLSRFLHLHF